MGKRIPVKRGDVYSELTIIEEVSLYITPGGTRFRRVRCKCSCGTIKIALLVDVRKGHTKSCGCLQRKSVVLRNTTHGHAGSLAHGRWGNIIQRCHNANDPSYQRYGARGIVVCDRWRMSFSAFLEDMGECPPGSSIERIDNDGPYSPDNCTWATPKAQNRNRRSNVNLTFQGRKMPIAAWAEELGLNYSTLYARLVRGWSIERALTTKPHVSATSS